MDRSEAGCGRQQPGAAAKAPPRRLVVVVLHNSNNDNNTDNANTTNRGSVYTRRSLLGWLRPTLHTFTCVKLPYIVETYLYNTLIYL